MKRYTVSFQYTDINNTTTTKYLDDYKTSYKNPLYNNEMIDLTLEILQEYIKEQGDISSYTKCTNIAYVLTRYSKNGDFIGRFYNFELHDNYQKAISIYANNNNLNDNDFDKLYNLFNYLQLLEELVSNSNLLNEKHGALSFNPCSNAKQAWLYDCNKEFGIDIKDNKQAIKLAKKYNVHFFNNGYVRCEY